MKKIILCILSAITLGCSSPDKAVVEKPIVKPVAQVIKGVWVTNVASSALNSLDNIKETVQICKKSGITDIFVVVWNKGRTLYPSEIMKTEFGIPIMESFAGRDPLLEMITEGHKAGLKIHAWFEYGFAASNGQNGGVILAKYPKWKAIDKAGNLVVSSSGFEWMNGINPEVQNFMKSLFLEVVTKYDIDGVQGDDRLPGMPSIGGYDDYTVQLYKNENNGQAPPLNEKDAAWLTWRANKLTAFLGNLYAAVKAVKPTVLVTMAPSIHPWAKENYLQDWPTWLDKGYCDFVIPQVYRYNITDYKATLTSQLSYISNPANRTKFFPGVLLQVGTFNPTLEYLEAMISENRNYNVKGEVFFFYEGLKFHSSYFQGKYITQ